MNRLLRGLIATILILQSLFFSGSAYAQDVNECTLTATNPSVIRTNTNTASFTINGGTNLVAGNSYSFMVNNKLILIAPNIHLTKATDAENNVTISNFDYNGVIHTSDNSSPLFPNPVTHSISVVPAGGGTPFCTVTFGVGYSAVSGNGCTPQLVNTPETTTSTNDILINVTAFVNHFEEGRKMAIKLFKLDDRGNQTGGDINNPGAACIFSQTTGCPGNLGTHEPGSYSIVVFDGYDTLSTGICGLKPIRIVQPGQQGGGVGTILPGGCTGGPPCIISGDFTGPPPTPVCDLTSSSGNVYNCHTAVGDISTSPGGFIENLMGLILSISGGLAVLLIIISGFRLMASQGNPEKVQQAREQLTAAIVGLLFVIFSLVILQFIGVDILKLPGFSS